MKIINHEVDGLQISQRIEDGYMNLTQMAKVNGKLIADYLRLDTTKTFLDKLSMVMGIPITKLVQIRKGKPAHLQGTWGHPKVAIHCAIWCDAEFAVFVTNLVFDWMTTGQNPIQPQATSTEIPSDLTAIVEELENLIVSIRSHGRIMHLGSHQPVDQTLFKSLHTLSHNQLSIINATIQQLELLKRIAEMDNADEATAPTSQQTINYLFSSPPPTENQGTKDEKTKETEVSQNDPQQLTNINIKIPSSQRQWLADTARMIRQNNTKPVPTAERVYPQHLVRIAIQLLQNSAIDIEAAHSILQEQDEPPANINIKISRQQQEWLTTTAKTIRNGNQQPTCPSDRIYPQHLIAIALAELQNAEIKWHRLENVSEIQKRLTTAYHLHLV
jgi:hypothetical protein